MVCAIYLFVVDPKVKKIDRLCVINATSPPYYVTNRDKGSCKVPRKQLVVYNASKGPKWKTIQSVVLISHNFFNFYTDFDYCRLINEKAHEFKITPRETSRAAEVPPLYTEKCTISSREELTNQIH